MKEENKKEVKKTILAGTGTAAGAAIGAVVENVFNPASAEAEEAIVADIAEENPDEAPVEANVTYAAAPVELDEVVVTAQAVSHAQAPHHSPAAPYHAEAEEDEPVMAAVVSVAPVESADPYDDIVVVNEGATAHSGAFDLHANITAPTPEIASAENPGKPLMASADHGNDLPDYLSEDDLSMKADGIGMNIAGTDANDMPDYINNANIDSFTDPI